MRTKVTVVKVGRPIVRQSMYHVTWIDNDGKERMVSIRGYGSAQGFAKQIRRELKKVLSA